MNVELRTVESRRPRALRRGILAATAALAVVASGLSPLFGAAPAQAAETELIKASFSGASEPDPGLIALNDACLTAAQPGAAAPAGASTLGGCTKTEYNGVTNPFTLGSGDGFLQLTDNYFNRTGGVVYNRPIPANKGLHVRFDQYQYGTSGADGISFILVDGRESLTRTGADGGSLGYAPRQGQPGVVGGYLGVGLDSWGNFSYDDEGRGVGCPPVEGGTSRKTHSLTLRGPGSGMEGYCLLQTKKVPQQLRAGTAAESKRTVDITVSNEEYPTVTIQILDQNGNLLLETTQKMAEPAPPTWKFGFASSTGGARDVHLIGNLQAWTLDELPPINLVKTVHNEKAEYQAGDTIEYRFLVTNGTTYPLTDVRVVDQLPNVTVECPASTLGPAGSPTASMECTGTHVVTKEEARAGTSLKNTATATGKRSGQELTSPEASATVTIKQVPALTVEKKAVKVDDYNNNGRPDVSDWVHYEFVVTNTGDTKLTDVKIDDPKVSNVKCPATELAPGESTTCTGTYSIKFADLDAGKVDNTAKATAKSGSETVNSDPSSVTTELKQVSGVVVTKTAKLIDANGNGVADAGETVEYLFKVKNTGNTTLTDVVISDPKLGENWTYTFGKLTANTETGHTHNYTVQQEDIDNGTLVNTVSVSAKDYKGETLTGESSATIDVVAPGPKIAIDKTAALNDQNGNGKADAGETITYSFTVTNQGNVTLTDVAVTDDMVGAVTCEATTLAPGASTNCSAEPYTVQQKDVDSGEDVKNVASVSGKDPKGGNVTDESEVVTVPPSDPKPALSIEKQGQLQDENGNGVADVNEKISYSFVVTNTGNVTMSNVAVTDPKVGAVTCPETTLAPGASTTCTAADYTVTQDDVDGGGVKNVATVTGTDPKGGETKTPSEEHVTPVDEANGALSIDKRAELQDGNDNGTADVNETIQYSFTVTNTGNVTLTNIAVSDPKAGTVTCDTTVLAPGAKALCTADAPYTVQQSDVDAGSVDNTATASGQPPAGEAVSATGTASTKVQQTPQLELTKSAPTDIVGAGDTVTYTFTVTNLGNVTLTGATVTDPRLGADWTCALGDLAPGATAECQGEYVVTQGDVDAGKLDNTAEATATSPAGVAVADSATATVPVEALAPSLTIVKRDQLNDANGNQAADVGETIDYTFTVVNNGNATISGVTVTDPKVGEVTCEATTLAPGESTECAATQPYTVIQDDVDAGAVKNVATVSGKAPNGEDVTTDSPEVETPTPLADAALKLEKRGELVDANENSTADLGEEVNYTFTLTNTGNVTVRELAVEDPKLGTVTCDASSLAPGASTECSAEAYTVVQDDIDSGSVKNVATASAVAANGTPVETESNLVELATPTSASLRIDKEGALQDENGNEKADVNEKITYSFTVTNTGAVTISGVRVTDPKVGEVTCQETTLAPGASTTCTAADYTVTQQDVDSGSVKNVASVTGKTPGGDDVTIDSPEVETPSVDHESKLSLEKRDQLHDANGNGKADAGETIAYTFEVRNTGNVTLTDVSVSDPKLGAVTCEADTLAPGESTTCSAQDYTVTPEDVAAGAVKNIASARGTDPRGGETTTESPEVVTPVQPVPTDRPTPVDPPVAPTPTPVQPSDTTSTAAQTGMWAAGFGILALAGGALLLMRRKPGDR